MSGHVVQVSAGRGPVEARRFVARLARRILARCAAAGLAVREVRAQGDAEAPRSVEIRVEGDAPAALAGELGTHALVERSERRGRASRKRWFAGVKVLPVPERAGAITAGDLEIKASRASGPGGQHVNKASTAVRVRHRPSGLAVRAEGERSRKANLARALARLEDRLTARAEERLDEAEAERRAAHRRLERGAAVRTYRADRRGELILLE
jgi:peptide chain release factor